MQITKFFADANFYISVIVLVYGGISAITENYSIFEFNEDLFGAIHNLLILFGQQAAQDDAFCGIFFDNDDGFNGILWRNQQCPY